MIEVPVPLLAELGTTGARLVGSGLVVGSGGNLSARLPGADVCWISASGTWLDALDPAVFSAVRIADGTVVGGHPRPSSEVPLHLAAYTARPDVNAIVHVHPQTSVLLAALGHRIALMTTDHVYYVREVAVTAWQPPGSPELAATAGAAVADGVNCVVLGNHGCSVVADSVELAHKRAVNLEEAARLTYAALVLTGGDPSRVPACPPAYAESLRDPGAGV